VGKECSRGSAERQWCGAVPAGWRTFFGIACEGTAAALALGADVMLIVDQKQEPLH
jgi:hypothetical protein